MKSKILLAVALLLAISTTSVWAADSSEKTNQKTGSYTNEDVWAAYEGFNNTLLDPDKYIYKTTSAYEQAVDRGHGAARERRHRRRCRRRPDICRRRRRAG